MSAPDQSLQQSPDALIRVRSSAWLGQFLDKLTRGDCLEVMKQMPDGSVDAVITDPPYCSGSVSEASRTAAKGQGLRSENIQRLGWFVGDNMGTAGLVWLIRSMAVESLRLLKACTNEAGHLWRPSGYAKDGTAFFQCLRCGEKSDGL